MAPCLLVTKSSPPSGGLRKSMVQAACTNLLRSATSGRHGKPPMKARITPCPRNMPLTKSKWQPNKTFHLGIMCAALKRGRLLGGGLRRTRGSATKILWKEEPDQSRNACTNAASAKRRATTKGGVSNTSASFQRQKQQTAPRPLNSGFRFGWVYCVDM